MLWWCCAKQDAQEQATAGLIFEREATARTSCDEPWDDVGQGNDGEWDDWEGCDENYDPLGEACEDEAGAYDEEYWDGEAVEVHADGNEECDTTAESTMATERTTSWTATLVKTSNDGACGWQLDYMDGQALFVSDVLVSSDTPVQVYNESAPEGRQIRRGDYVIEVNGRTSMQAMSQALTSQKCLKVKVIRPSVVELTLRKGALELGLDLRYSEGAPWLLVEAVGEGCVREAKADVRPRDRILAVNGQAGCTQKLLSALKASDPVTLLISRCPAASR